MINKTVIKNIFVGCAN